MATDLERLVVSLEASVTKFDRAMAKASGDADKSAKRIERRFDSMNSRLQTGFSNLQRGIATAFGSAVALRSAQQLIDASTRIENSLRVSGLAGEDLTAVYGQLFRSAQRNAAPIEALSTLYGRAAQVQKELGASSEDLVKFTDNIAVALRLQGGDAEAASGALLQLGQALGSARVFAEEFNSINEGARPILQAAAAGIEEAGGSVAKLKQLVIEGKVSNQAFFQGIQAGAGILEDKLAAAEFTVSQGFVRFQNVLIDVAGRFNETSGAGQRFVSFLDVLGNKIDEISRSEGFERALNDLGDAIQQTFSRDLKDIERIGALLEQLKTSFDRFGPSVTDADLALGEAEQALASFAQNTAGSFGAVDAAAQDLFQQILAGKGTADLAAEALAALGDADPDFAPLLQKIGVVIQQIYALRAQAVAATNMDPIGEGASFADVQSLKFPTAVKPVSLSDYPVTGGSGSGGGAGKKSPAQKFGDEASQMSRRIDMLKQETEARRQLNPLIDDYGFAVERLKAQLDLENAAKEAGLPLDDERRQQIDELSTGYAQATAEAARLAEAQDQARQSAEELAQAGRQALDSIIDGFLEGRDAGEILNSTLKELGKNLLKMGLDSIGGGMKAGGFNPLGFLGSLFGFASGTANTGGQRGEPRGVVHGQEAVIPLPSGGKVPVEVRMPPAASATPQALQVHIVSDDEKFGAYVTDKAGAVVAQSAPAIVGASVNQANQTAPGAVAKFQQQRGGADYRTM